MHEQQRQADGVDEPAVRQRVRDQGEPPHRRGREPEQQRRARSGGATCARSTRMATGPWAAIRAATCTSTIPAAATRTSGDSGSGTIDQT